MDAAKKKYPCGKCGELGHWHRECPKGGSGKPHHKKKPGKSKKTFVCEHYAIGNGDSESEPSEPPGEHAIPQCEMCGILSYTCKACPMCNLLFVCVAEGKEMFVVAGLKTQQSMKIQI